MRLSFRAVEAGLAEEVGALAGVTGVDVEPTLDAAAHERLRGGLARVFARQPDALVIA